ncbi:MAG TPA: hypothetical protein VJK48_00660 [Chlamydiales bacterium]|nr:MAG: hypothetical protein A3F67_08510 [Verrucomicrobia bacterium RIFCSPHIGHO2_12_FULL_41_10]HLB52205.1 hypothetical protein [Chlamydiales bacterium]
MSEIIEKVKSAIKSMEKEHGNLLICALFLRADVLEKWDIVLAAPWLNPKEMRSYEILSSSLQNFLTQSELVQFSRIVILEQDDPTVSFLLNLEIVKNGGYKELSVDALSEKFRFTIKKAYLLRSQKSEK